MLTTPNKVTGGEKVSMRKLRDRYDENWDASQTDGPDEKHS